MSEQTPPRGGSAAFLVPATLGLAAIWYLIDAHRIAPLYDGNGVGPAFFPKLLAITLLLALIWVVIGEIRGRRDKAVQCSGGVTSDTALTLSLTGRVARPLLVVAATALYVLAFPRLGYGAATFLYAYALLWILAVDERRHLVRLLHAAGIAAAGYGLFALAFSVRLPGLSPDAVGLGFLGGGG